MPEPILRPIERVVVKLHQDGASVPEIGRRIGKKPGTVDRIIRMIGYRSDMPVRSATGGGALRPIERVVLRLRADGESYGEIANRLARSGRHVREIERYALIKTDG